MQWRVPALATAAVAAACTFLVWRGALADDPVQCDDPPDHALRYPTVEPIFESQCGECHDARVSDNAAAQRVFESSSYPFSTQRPDSLLDDLTHMFEVRGSLSREQKCTGLHWLAGGARDADGRPPTWRK